MHVTIACETNRQHEHVCTRRIQYAQYMLHQQLINYMQQILIIKIISSAGSSNTFINNIHQSPKTEKR